MSNGAVGPLYQAVIEGVIREARADFEDMGEHESTLLDLQREWQTRLSAMNVRPNMPWDLPETKPNMGMSGGNMPYYLYNLEMPNLSQGGMPGGNTSLDQMNPIDKPLGGFTDPPLKEEPGINEKDDGFGNLGLDSGHSMLQLPGQIPHIGSTGQQPSSQIQLQLPSDLSLPGEGRTRGLELPDGGARPQMPQNDGAPARDEDVMSIIRKIMQQVPQVDGASQDEFVGSDLDDSEEELNSEEDEDGADRGMVMLCLYEKVQRVKNKWKYVLKDGVANVNGLDYVFTRANGESEW